MAKRDNGGDPIVVAIDSFTVGNLTVIRHNTYRESSPAVQARPEAFISVDSTTDERHRAHLDLMAAERRRVGLPE